MRRNFMWLRVVNSGLLLVCLAVVSLSCSKEDSGGGKAATSGQENASGTKIFKASDPGSLKLAFVTNNASEFWKIAAAGVHKYEKEAGVQVDIKMPPNGKTEEQNQILENLASQGYDGIAVSVSAPNDQVPVLNKVAAKTNLLT